MVYCWKNYADFRGSAKDHPFVSPCVICVGHRRFSRIVQEWCEILNNGEVDSINAGA